MRSAALALAVPVLAALGCEAKETATCPGAEVATFRLKGPLVYRGDPGVGALDPVPELPDCTPDPFDLEAPIRYPHLLPPFDAKLAADPGTNAAALCRPNGVVYAGQRSADLVRYALEADAEPAVICSACAASLRVIVVGDVAPAGGGTPTAFGGILVEALTELRGACGACLPLVPAAGPPLRACAARYALEGAAR